MYHLIKYLRSSKLTGNPANLIAGNDEKIRNYVDKGSKKLMLLFGLVVIIPLMAGVGLSLTFGQIVLKYDYLLLGILLSVLLSLVLKSKLPDFPIGLKNTNSIH